jgi:hypothetical protein
MENGGRIPANKRGSHTQEHRGKIKGKNNRLTVEKMGGNRYNHISVFLPIIGGINNEEYRNKQQNNSFILQTVTR